MDTLTIELREKDAQNNYGNGDWESVVQDNITLEDGDAVVLKSCFLDTESVSNQKVTIDRDITLQYEVAYAVSGLTTFFDDNGTAKTSSFPYNPFFASTSKPEENKVTEPRNVTHLVYDSVPKEIGEDTLFNGFQFGRRGDINRGIYTAPAFNINYTFRAEGAALDETRSLRIPEFNYDDNHPIQTVTVPPFLVVKDSVTFSPTASIIESKYQRGTATVFYFNNPELGPDSYLMELATRRFTIKVPAGTYSPPELCNLINTETTTSKFSDEEIDENDKETYYGNPVLRSSRLVDFAGTPLAGYNSTDFVLLPTEWRGAGKGVRINGYNILMGANQVELSFDDSTQLFQINQAHTSFYDNKGNAIVRYLRDPDEIPAIQDSYSQLVFTNLSAEDENGEYYDFWNAKLGFVVDDLISKETGIVSYAEGVFMGGIVTTTNNAYYLWPQMEVVPGKNVTTDLPLVDGLFNSNPTATTPPTAANEFYVPFPSSAIVSATTSTTQRIIAETSLFNRGDTFGYFLLDIQANMGGSFIMSNQNKQSIKAIVGRFYELNSYTTGTSGDGLVYVHRGQPVFLDSFKCRVLDGSTKKVATDLGSDSTIFLQVVKAPPRPALPAPPQKK